MCLSDGTGWEPADARSSARLARRAGIAVERRPKNCPDPRWVERWYERSLHEGVSCSTVLPVRYRL